MPKTFVPTRRRVLAGLAGTPPLPALVQSDKPVLFILPNGTGSGFDTIARSSQNALAKALGLSIIIASPRRTRQCPSSAANARSTRCW